VGAGPYLPAASREEPGRPEVELRRRSRDREQGPSRPYRVGADPEGRVPALPCHARLRPALPERVRLPGPLDRGRRGTGARPELEEGDRVLWPGRVRPQVPGEGHLVGNRADQREQGSRAVDGLGERLLHVLRHEHRVHLAVPQSHARARLALPGVPIHRVVPPVRDVDVAARAVPGGRLPGEDRPLDLCAPPAPGASRRGTGHLDHHAVDPPGQRGGRGEARRGIHLARGRDVGGPSPVPPRSRGEDGARLGSGWPDVRRAVRSPSRRRPRPPSGHLVGRGLA
jgi:hypothetical protein